MASEAQDARAQADVVAAARAAATRHLHVPFWFRFIAGLGLGFAVFAIATLNLPLSLAGLLTLTMGSRLMSFILIRSTGMRLRELGGGSAAWLKITYLVGTAVALLAAIGLDSSLHSWWPGSIIGVLVAGGTFLVGIGRNWLLRHDEEV